MSVLEVLKTRTGVKNLLLPNGDRDENIVAFEYIDKKVEVHSLNVSLNLALILEESLHCESQRLQAGNNLTCLVDKRACLLEVNGLPCLIEFGYLAQNHVCVTLDSRLPVT